jgi:hypothetical protein
VLPVRKTCHGAFLVAAPLQGYLDRLLRADFNPFEAKVLQADPLLPAKLLWHRFRGTF